MVASVNKLDPRGKFVVEHYDVNGKLKGKYDFPNGIVDEGKDLILDVMFNDGVAIAQASWYIGLVDLSGFTALADADTMASHSGWNEFTSYSEANRVAWGSGAASSQSTTNASPATFNVSGSGTVKGVFVTSNNTKGGTSGTLWASALFASDVPVSNGDQLKVTYTVSA
jgi:hypothetical protein